jgi:hypothetical protein
VSNTEEQPTWCGTTRESLSLSVAVAYVLVDNAMRGLETRAAFPAKRRRAAIVGC